MVSTGWGGVMVKLNPDPNLIGQAAKHFDSQIQFQTHKYQSVPKYQSKSSKTLHSYKDPNKRLHEIEITIGTAFKPMLADGSILIGDIEALMKHKPFY